eukprot:4776949-Amphidinium_carterae.1
MARASKRNVTNISVACRAGVYPGLLRSTGLMRFFGVGGARFNFGGFSLPSRVLKPAREQKVKKHR